MAKKDWDLLVSQIQERKVVPVIGPDLITVSCDGKPMPYDRYIAQRLAQLPDYGVTDADLEPLGVTLEHATLNDVRWVSA